MSTNNSMIESIITKTVLSVGVLALAVAVQFALAKITKITLVISPTHCYFGSTSEIPSNQNEGGY